MKKQPACSHSPSLYLRLCAIVTLICILFIFTACNNKADSTISTDTAPSADVSTETTDIPDTKTSETNSSEAQDTKAPETPSGSEAPGTTNPEETTARFEILKVTDESMLVCGLENASGLYTVGHGSILENAGGQAIEIKDLKPKMIVDLTWNGMVQESYPAQFSYDRLKDTGETGSDTLTLYKHLIEELAAVDPGLNDGIKQSYFDFTKIDTLSDAEKEGLAYMCGSYFNVWGSLATREELAADGILDPQKGLVDSILITIEEISVEENTIKLNAEKYRSGTGAYYFHDVTATYKDGEYTYEIGSHMIS